MKHPDRHRLSKQVSKHPVIGSPVSPHLAANRVCCGMRRHLIPLPPLPAASLPPSAVALIQPLCFVAPPLGPSPYRTDRQALVPTCNRDPDSGVAIWPFYGEQVQDLDAGIPMVLMSGWIAADALDQDMRDASRAASGKE